MVRVSDKVVWNRGADTPGFSDAMREMVQGANSIESLSQSASLFLATEGSNPK